MKRLNAGLAIAGLVGGVWFVGAAVPSQASSLPTVSTCLPPSGQSVPAGTASGVVTVIGAQASSGTFSCSYTDTSTTAPQYGAATPNAFSITATHTIAATIDPTTGTASCSSGTLNSAGSCTVTDAAANGAPATDVQSGTPQQGDVNGTLTGAKAGDTVTVTVTLTCVPQDPTGQGCGGIGTIAVGSPQ
jgi:hypothetical protein